MLQEERGFAISLKTHDFAMKGINDSLFAANSHFSRIFEEIVTMNETDCHFALRRLNLARLDVSAMINPSQPKTELHTKGVGYYESYHKVRRFRRVQG
jgi:hypothetical protein